MHRRICCSVELSTIFKISTFYQLSMSKSLKYNTSEWLIGFSFSSPLFGEFPSSGSSSPEAGKKSTRIRTSTALFPIESSHCLSKSAVKIANK
ncbi:unnamed protein product [Rhizophagus irregularis]|nr:unnamed protein product [Rhizophagus irregularis]